MSGKIDFIHIGLPKTGSTYLQRVFFRQHPEINCLGSGTSQSVDKEFILLVRKMVNGQSFLHESDEIRRRLKDLLVKNKGGKNNCINGISAEGLSQTIYDSKMVTHVACMLNKIAPEAKIVLFIRNQKNMIESLYRQYIIEGGNKNINEFLLSPQNWSSLDYSNFDIDGLDVQNINRFKYYQVVKTYIDLFGKENVYIGMQEKLKDERIKVFNDINSLMGINNVIIDHEENVNAQKKYFQYELLRFANNFFASDVKRSKGLPFASILYRYISRLEKYEKNINENMNKYYREMRISMAVRRRIIQYIMKLEFGLRDKKYYDFISKEVKDYMKYCYALDNNKLDELCKLNMRLYKYFI